jgi:cysteine desulfurase family protein (TIGR01976 family)
MIERSEVTPTTAAIDEIRASFPALSRTQGGRTVGYFDAPGGTQVPATVAEAVAKQMLLHNANAHWAFETSRELDEVIAASRSALADLLGGRSDEIVFGPNMTTLTFHLARALGRTFQPEDEIVVTELDHMANVSPWMDLQSERGLLVRVVPLVPETGDLDWAELENAVSSRTRLIAVTSASNALGTIVDLARVASIARSAGALLFVDAVHLAPHERIDVAAMGCDFLACSPYKFYGPHVGVLWGRGEILQDVLPPKLAPAPSASPERWETGTLNHEGIAGAGAAVDFLAGLTDRGARPERLDAVFEELSRRGDELVRKLWDGLDSLGGVQLYGPRPGSHSRTPTVSFTIDAIAPAEAAARLSSDWALYLSHGNFYASLVTERLGVEPQGLLRAGCACYTNQEEIDRLIAAVGELAAGS